MTSDSSRSDWLSLREAADILGVHPATVRNWADRGDLPARRTPGGHRRFRRGDLERWVEARQSPPSAEIRMLVQSALGKTRMRLGEGEMRRMPWSDQLDAATRDGLRQQGRAILEALENYLADPPDDTSQDASIIALGREYAHLLLGHGFTLSQTLEGFLFFNDFLFDAALNIVEVAGARSPHEWLALLRQVRRFSNHLLLGVVYVYDEAAENA